MQQHLQANTAVYQKKTLIITLRWWVEDFFSFEINLNLVEYKTETYLVWVLNVDTESKLLQYTTLSFDHLVFRGDVILV